MAQSRIINAQVPQGLQEMLGVLAEQSVKLSHPVDGREEVSFEVNDLLCRSKFPPRKDYEMVQEN